MRTDPNEIFNLAIIYLGAFFVSALIFAWIFSLVFQTSKQVKLLRCQLRILVKLAEKQGVPKDEIDSTIMGVMGKD